MLFLASFAATKRSLAGAGEELIQTENNKIMNKNLFKNNSTLILIFLQEKYDDKILEKIKIKNLIVFNRLYFRDLCLKVRLKKKRLWF